MKKAKRVNKMVISVPVPRALLAQIEIFEGVTGRLAALVAESEDYNLGQYGREVALVDYQLGFKLNDLLVVSLGDYGAGQTLLICQNPGGIDRVRFKIDPAIERFYRALAWQRGDLPADIVFTILAGLVSG